MKINFKKNIEVNENGIINLGELLTGGTHWVCYWNSANDKFVEYFDSFGLPPDPRIIDFLKTSGKHILFNTGKLQENSNSTCGFYCAYFLHEKNNQRPFEDILLDFKPNDEQYNEDKILNFAKNFISVINI